MEARPGPFAGEWTLVWADGSTLRIDCSLLSRTAKMKVEGETLEMSPADGLGELVLRAGKEILARAERTSIWWRSYELETAGERYSMEPMLRGGYQLRKITEAGRTDPLGEVRREHWSSDRQADLPRCLPRAVQAFAFWIAAVVEDED